MTEYVHLSKLNIVADVDLKIVQMMDVFSKVENIVGKGEKAVKGFFSRDFKTRSCV